MNTNWKPWIPCPESLTCACHGTLFVTYDELVEHNSDVHHGPR